MPQLSWQEAPGSLQWPSLQFCPQGLIDSCQSRCHHPEMLH